MRPLGGGNLPTLLFCIQESSIGRGVHTGSENYRQYILTGKIYTRILHEFRPIVGRIFLIGKILQRLQRQCARRSETRLYVKHL